MTICNSCGMRDGHFDWCHSAYSVGDDPITDVHPITPENPIVILVLEPGDFAGVAHDALARLEPTPERPDGIIGMFAHDGAMAPIGQLLSGFDLSRAETLCLTRAIAELGEEETERLTRPEPLAMSVQFRMDEPEPEDVRFWDGPKRPNVSRNAPPRYGSAPNTATERRRAERHSSRPMPKGRR